MVDIYVRWIKAGKMSIDDVPVRWRSAVENKLSEDSQP